MYICVYLYISLYIGRIPYQLCDVTGLTSLQVQNNTLLTCYPECLTTMSDTDTNFGEVLQGCPSLQQDTLCYFVAATNIGSIHPEWACDSIGYTLTNPCGEYVNNTYVNNTRWNGLNCNEIGMINAFEMESYSVIGSLPDEFWLGLSSVETLILRNNSLTGMCRTRNIIIYEF